MLKGYADTQGVLRLDILHIMAPDMRGGRGGVGMG